MIKHNLAIIFSLFLLPILFGIVTLDMVGIFSFSDIPLVIAAAVYLMFLRIQRTTSIMTFGIALFLLIWMGLSYIPTGASLVTERLGVWFYVFFVFGLVQCVRETKFL